MDESYWIRFLPWRCGNWPKSKLAQIEFAPTLEITREHDWVYLELQLVNRFAWTVRVREASCVSIGLDAKQQTAVSNGQSRYEILQNVEPQEVLRVSLARTIYDAAGRPQAPYSILVSTNARYRVFGERCEMNLETCCVEMAALTLRGLHKARWHDKKTRQINRSAGLMTKEHKGWPVAG